MTLTKLQAKGVPKNKVARQVVPELTASEVKSFTKASALNTKENTRKG
jgi:hypothetical protein